VSRDGKLHTYISQELQLQGRRAHRRTILQSPYRPVYPYFAASLPSPVQRVAPIGFVHCLFHLDSAGSPLTITANRFLISDVL
jgi:hypothetical protein